MLRHSLVLIAVSLLSAFAHAEVLELEGTVKAVDASARSLSVTRTTPSGEKTLKLEVAKKAGDLAPVKVGDRITFSYDPDLEIVTKIGAETGSVSADVEAVALKELHKGYNSAPWVSADGLRLYWQSADVSPSGDGERWIWQATRKTHNDLFEQQTKLVPGSDGTLTEDELCLFVFEGETVRLSTRENRDAAFARSKAIAELKQFGRIARPCVSADGLVLWFEQLGTEGRIIRVTRESRTSPWTNPETVDRRTIGAGNGFSINPVDGYGVFAMKVPLVEGTRFCVARTDDRGLSFSNVKPLIIPNAPEGKQPFYCKATNELFYAGMPGPDKSSQLFVVRDYELPETK